MKNKELIVIKVNENTYPLAINTERYKKVAGIVNPLLNERCGQLEDDKAKGHFWGLIPIAVNDQETTFILLNEHDWHEPKHIGIEIPGSMFSDESIQPAPIPKWFTFHKESGTKKVYHASSLEALEDERQWLPEEYATYFMDEYANSGRLEWRWWDRVVYFLEKLFEEKSIRHEDWEASPGRFQCCGDITMDKVAIFCKNSATGQHLGFIMEDPHHVLTWIHPVIVSQGVLHCLLSIEDALKLPQDTLEDRDIDKYTLLATKYFAGCAEID